MKKILSVLLASAVSLSCAAPVFAADTFTDVNSKSYSWAYEYVEKMAEEGLISGYEDGTFRPGASVSRMEAFALFARLMGASYEQNADAVEAAKEKYADVLTPYSLSYAEGDVAFMLSRGVLSENELDTYFSGSKKSQPMPRYEAAILITKAMLAEETAKNEVLLDMEYTDVADIPASAKQYVYYVTQKGIMNGMGDGKFSPETSVLRGQIAVMLSKTSDSVNYTFENVTVSSVDTAKKNMTIRDAEGRTDEIGYTSGTIFVKDGEKIKDSDLKAGQSVVLTYSEDDSGIRLVFADVAADVADKTISAVYQGYASQSGQLTLTALNPETGETTVYDCSSAATVLVDGALSDINKIQRGSYVTIGLAGDKVVSVSTMQRTDTIREAVLEAITPLGSITIKSDDEKYNGMTYVLSNEVAIYKNGSKAEFSDLYRGDTLTLTLDYGVVSKIVATSKTGSVTGTIKSYTISSSPTLTVRKDGEDITYDIPSDVKITLNGETAKLADFEIGMSVTLKFESDAVTEITASTTSGMNASSITGTVTGVNASAKVIIISYDEGGSQSSAYITCTNNTKYYVIPTLSEYSLNNIKVGDTIIAYGAYSNGIFVSTGITVTPSGK